MPGKEGLLQTARKMSRNRACRGGVALLRARSYPAGAASGPLSIYAVVAELVDAQR